MTSDAKIGLLLGLVFIFIIAFVINGLPGLHHKDDSNRLTNEMVGLKNSQPGLGANERKLALESAAPAAPQTVMQPAAGGLQPGQTAVENTQSTTQSTGVSEPRFTIALPPGVPTSADTASASPAATEPLNAVPSGVNPSAPSAATLPTVKTSPAASGPAQVAQPAKTQTAKPAAQVYVVQNGDSLSSIAKKVYGPELGNKIIAVRAIFEANRKTLATIDDLQVGQKLVILPLPASAAPAPTAASKTSPATPGVLSGTDFVKVDSVGKRNTTTPPASANSEKQPAPKADAAKTGKTYIVKEGDSLWRIAAEQLGDGNRYKEIVKLNSSILSSEDDIQVDMELKLPAK